MKVYQMLKSISLDKAYLEGLADGKAKVLERECELTPEMEAELKRLNERTFDFEHYNRLLEDCKEDEAYNYIMKNGKDIVL